ncbi:MAG: ABC transporter permease subunit, partial [Bacteroidota bacterium]
PEPRTPMFSTLLEKELKAILLSPKFVATFAVCTLLILLSVFIGIQEYKAGVEQYTTAQELLDQEVREATSWWSIGNRAFREPNPVQIFAAGVENDIGRFSRVNAQAPIKLQQSAYSDNPLFAFFRSIDFTFIVQVVLSLFAILFTYNAINGERESGTLKLAFSNAVPRGQFVAAKFAGAWLGLTIPILIPILISMLLVMVLGVPMTGVGWSKVGMLLGASVLYFTFFIALGLLVSALTKHSNVSFLVLLVAWVVLVLIVPRAGTMLAGQMRPTASVAEIESKMDRFQTERWRTFVEDQSAMWERRTAEMQGLTGDERAEYSANNREAWDAEQSDMRAQVEIDLAEFNRKLNEELRNEKAEQERLAFTLSRFSPASSYQLTAMNLAGTNTTLKQRYEEAIFDYRDQYSAFALQKRQEERAAQRERQRNTQGVMFLGSTDETIDASEMPRFVAPVESTAEALQPSVIDLGLLSLYGLLAFAGAFVAFLRYDVR